MVKTFFPDKEFAAFLFDFDGTIADTMPPHFDSWNHALSLYGLSLSTQQHQSWAGRPTREIVRLLGDLHGVELAVEEIIKASFGKIPMAIVSGSRRKPVETTLGILGMAN